MMDVMTRDPAELTETAARLRHTSTRLIRAMRRQSVSGLTTSQLTALGTIVRLGPLPIGVLADEEQIGAPTATKLVDKLVRAGYVERHADPGDRRVSLVAATPAGTDLLDDVRARRTAWLTSRLADLPDDEYDALVVAIEVLDHLTAPPPSRREAEPSTKALA
jgi:DNA-binding MarR family transcriptional regulator